MTRFMCIKNHWPKVLWFSNQTMLSPAQCMLHVDVMRFGFTLTLLPKKHAGAVWLRSPFYDLGVSYQP